MDPQELPTDPHRHYEDVMAMLIGTLFVALALLPMDRVGLSVLGAVALNLIIALNHKPGRYMGVS